MKIKEMAEELDKLPLGSSERIKGIEFTIGSYTIVLKEPALLYAPGGVMYMGPNTGESGGGYRLEVLEEDGFPAFIQNSPTLDGILEALHKKIDLCGVFEEIV